MCIDVADAVSEQFMLLDEAKNLILSGNCDLRQVMKVLQHLRLLLEMAECNFSDDNDDKWMRRYLSLVEQPGECGIAAAQMIDPDRSISQDHFGVDLL